MDTPSELAGARAARARACARHSACAVWTSPRQKLRPCVLLLRSPWGASDGGTGFPTVSKSFTRPQQQPNQQRGTKESRTSRRMEQQSALVLD
jgi:hypothetical protein